MIEVELRLFGSFRRYSDTPSVIIRLPEKCTVHACKEIIAQELRRLRPEFGAGDLVFASALADDKAILQDRDEIQSSCTLAILPPVCGG